VTPIFIAASGRQRIALLRDALVSHGPIVSSLAEAKSRITAAGECMVVVDAAVSWASSLLAAVGDDPACAIIVAADHDHLTKLWKLLSQGADGYIVLPADPVVVTTSLEAARQARARRNSNQVQIEAVRGQLMRVAEDFRFSYQRERSHARELATLLQRMEGSYRETVKSLAAAVEAKDPLTGRHIERVTDLAVRLANVVDPALAAEPHLAFGFLLHDVGKIGVPDAILMKPGPLNKEEAERMRAHALIGARIVQDVEFLRPVHAIIRHHHERWDGKGYPDGLTGERIPKGARVFAVADAADAMLHDRPYRKAVSLDQVRQEITRVAGAQFDPEVVEAFIVLTESEEDLVHARAVEEPAQ
jgi:response regulator RpfG family c-di-GMP phosphodiesterase